MLMTKLADSPPHTILLVEDEPQVRRLLVRILLTERAKIITAATGVQALQIAGKTPVDLVILDVRLPDMNGTEVLRRLRGINAGLAVIMISGYGSARTVRTAMELGASEFLTKPFRNLEIRRVVREALALGGASATGQHLHS